MDLDAIEKRSLQKSPYGNGLSESSRDVLALVAEVRRLQNDIEWQKGRNEMNVLAYSEEVQRLEEEIYEARQEIQRQQDVLVARQERIEKLEDLARRLAEELDHLSWSLRAQQLVQEAADAGLVPEVAARLAEAREKGVK